MLKRGTRQGCGSSGEEAKIPPGKIKRGFSKLSPKGFQRIGKVRKVENLGDAISKASGRKNRLWVKG